VAETTKRWQRCIRLGSKVIPQTLTFIQSAWIIHSRFYF
jgi:hypothetical protein